MGKERKNINIRNYMENFEEDLNEWLSLGQVFCGEKDAKCDFGQFLVNKYYNCAREEVKQLFTDN